MILVGSRAAETRGHLPPWRQGRMVDWDLHARPEQIEAFAAAHPDMDRRGRQFLGGGLWVGFFEWGAVSEALMACPDLEPCEVFGEPAWCIGLPSQIALKAAYRWHARVHAEKSERDLTYWFSILNPDDWRPAHQRVYDAMQARADVLFSRER